MSAFRTFSNILQLRTEAFAEMKSSPRGMRYAASQLIVVGLVAGFGIWIGLPALLQKPLLEERINDTIEVIDQAEQEILPAVNDFLNSVSEDQLGARLAELVKSGELATAQTLSQLVDEASVSIDSVGAAITEEAQELTADERSQVQQQIDQIKARVEANEIVPPEEITKLLDQARVSADAVVGSLQTAGAGERVDQLRAQVEQGAPQLSQLAAQVSTSFAGLQSRLLDAFLRSDGLARAVSRIGLSDQQVTAIRDAVRSAPESAKALLARASAEAERVEPPLGGRPSRVVHMFGEWLSTPLTLLAQWAYFALALLAVVKLLGGRGTLRQHVVGVLLASAPLVLLFFTFVPNLTPTMSSALYEAFQIFGRTLALIGLLWALLVLLKSMSVTHEIGPWRSAGAIALTWVTLYVIVPIASLAALNYILRG